MTTIDNVTELISSEDRHFLIRKGLQQPSVVKRRSNAPTEAALVDNAIYAVEQALKENPRDELLNRCYAAMRVEYSQHFRPSSPIVNSEKPVAYIVINN